MRHLHMIHGRNSELLWDDVYGNDGDGVPRQEINIVIACIWSQAIPTWIIWNMSCIGDDIQDIRDELRQIDTVDCAVAEIWKQH